MRRTGIRTSRSSLDFDPAHLHEEDWDTDIEVFPDFHVHVLPSQHFSGRLLEQNATQWASFAIVTSEHKVYYSGDGGYGAHFRAIGEQFGGFDLALMENGQYDRRWHRIHMLPYETAQAATDLRGALCHARSQFEVCPG